MTAVLFKFHKPDGKPVVEAPFSVSLRKPTFDELLDTGIIIPGAVLGITDEKGECTLNLSHGYGIYYLSMLLEESDANSGSCANGFQYKFVVPESDELVRVEDLIVTNPTWSRPWDEQALAIITDAKLAAEEAARAAAASATKAEDWAQSIVGDAATATEAAASALASKNAAAVSAANAGDSRTAAQLSATAASNSASAASVSANAANNSALSASGDAGRAAASATAAKASETSATGSASTAGAASTSATASKTAAETAANTATTKAAEASTSAGTASTQAAAALTQANRAKTEADRAAAATDSKQPLNTTLTNLANAAWTANSYPVFAADKSVSIETISDEARIFNRQPDPASMRSRLGLVKTANNTDSTLGRVMVVGDFGMGAQAGLALPGNNAQQALPNGRYFTTSQWAGSPFSGLDVLNQGVLDVATWQDTNYTRQRWTPINPATAAPRSRYSVNGVWQPWVIDPTLETAARDPEALTGGLIYTTVISGYTVFKFSNGLLMLTGQAGESGVLPANTATTATITLPTIGFISLNFIQPSAMITPYQAYDLVGAPQCIMTSLNALRLIITTGPTSQNSARAVTVWGRWK